MNSIEESGDWKDWSKLVLTQIQDLNQNYKKLVDLRVSDNENFMSSMNDLKTDISQLRLEFNHVNSNMTNLERWHRDFNSTISLDQMKKMVSEHENISKELHVLKPQIERIDGWKSKMNSISTPENFQLFITEMSDQNEKNKSFRIKMITAFAILQGVFLVIGWAIKHFS